MFDNHELQLKFEELQMQVEDQGKTINVMIITIIIGFLIFAVLPWIMFAVLT